MQRRNTTTWEESVVGTEEASEEEEGKSSEEQICALDIGPVAMGLRPYFLPREISHPAHYQHDIISQLKTQPPRPLFAISMTSTTSPRTEDKQHPHSI